MAIIAQKADEDHKGSTTAKGSFTINEDGGAYTVHIDFSVKKTGVNGTGHGSLAFILLGEDGKSIHQWTPGKSVGAELDGEHTKTDSIEFTIFGDKWDKVIGFQFKVNADSDTIGVPTDIGGWTELLGEDLLPLLGGLGLGEAKDVAGWIIGRLK